MLLVNTSSGENVDVPDSKVDGLIRAGTHSFVGGPESIVSVRSVSGRVSSVYPGRAAAVIQEGGTFVPAGEVERMRENKEFASSTLGALAAAPYGFDDWMFAGAGGNAIEAMGLTPEGMREEVQSANPFIWNAAGLAPTAMAVLMSGGTYGAARAAGGTALAAAKTAARQAGSSASKGAVVEAAKNLGKAGYYGAKGATLSPFNMVTASDIAGQWAGKGVDRAIAHLAGRPMATSLSNSTLARFIGTSAARTASGVSRGLVEGGLWGAGEGLSESMLGPPDQVAETVLEHIKTNALIGAAFGGAVGNVIPALTGAKRMMMTAGKLGMKGVGYAEDVTVENMRPWLLKVAKEMGIEGKELDWYEKVLQKGDAGDEARKQMYDMVKRIDKYSTDVAMQIESMFLIEDLRQMADVHGHDMEVVFKRIAGTDGAAPGQGSTFHLDDDGTFTETWSRSSARPGRTDAAITPGEARAVGLEDVPDVIPLGALPQTHLDFSKTDGVNIRSRETGKTVKTYKLPGLNDLLTGTMEMFATAKTALLELAEKEPKRDANFELTRMVKKIMDMEAGFYLSMFSPQTKAQYFRNLRKIERLPEDTPEPLGMWEKQSYRKWMNYWRDAYDHTTPTGKAIRKRFEKAAAAKGLAGAPKAGDPDAPKLYEDYFPEAPATVDVPPRADEVIRRMAQLQDNIDEFFEANLKNRGDPLTWEHVEGKDAVFDKDLGWTSKSTRELEKLIRDPENSAAARRFIEKEIAEAKKDISKWGEQPEMTSLYRENDAKKKVKRLEELLGYVGSPQRELLGDAPQAAAEVVSDENTRKVFKHLTTDGVKPTIAGVMKLLGLSRPKAKLVMDGFVEAGLLVKKPRGYALADDAPRAGYVDPDPSLSRYDPEDLEQALHEALENENPEPIIKMAEELGVNLKLPKWEGKRMDPSEMENLKHKRLQANQYTAKEREFHKIWDELIDRVNYSVDEQSLKYGRIGSKYDDSVLAKVKDDYRRDLNIQVQDPLTGETRQHPFGRKNYPPSLLHGVVRHQDEYGTIVGRELIPDFAKRVVEDVSGAQSRSARLTAELYGYLEHLSTDLLKATQYGALRGTYTAPQIVDTVIEPIRQRLKDRGLWLGQAKAKDDFDQLAGEFQKYRDQVIADFAAEVGGEFEVSPDKVLAYISGLNKYNQKPNAKRLNGYMEKGIELLKKIKDDFQSVDLSELADMGAEEVKAFQKRWERLRIPDAPDPNLGGKALWDWYLGKLIERFENQQKSILDNVNKLEEEYPLAKLFMGANAQAANLSQMTSEMSRGGIASFMAYALTGSPMAAAATGAGVGLATIGQNPQRMANFLHLISTFKNATDSYLDDGIKAWREDALPKMAEARGWEKKARQMFLMTPRAVTGDIKETREEMERRAGAERSNKYWVDRATKSFASQMTKEEYVEARESLTKMMMSPSTMNHFLEKSTELFEDTPDLRDAMKKSIRTKIQSAYSSMPKGTRVGFGAPMIEPTSLELREWGAKLQILNSPLDAMFSSMMSGTLTPEMVKTFKQNWPQLHTQLIEKALESMNNPEYGPMSQQQRMMLNTLLEGQFLNPSVAERLLQNYREEEGKKQGGAPQAAAPRMMKRETEQMITAMQTPVEQILA